MRKRFCRVLLLIVIAALCGCASSPPADMDDDPRNDPQQYWKGPPGFTPFSA